MKPLKLLLPDYSSTEDKRRCAASGLMPDGKLGVPRVDLARGHRLT